MLMIMPKGYSELKDNIKRKVLDLVQENNISYRFAFDSKGIDDAIDTLTVVLWRLKTESKPELTKKELKYFKEQKEIYLKEEKDGRSKI